MKAADITAFEAQRLALATCVKCMYETLTLMGVDTNYYSAACSLMMQRVEEAEAAYLKLKELQGETTH